MEVCNAEISCPRYLLGILRVQSALRAPMKMRLPKDLSKAFFIEISVVTYLVRRLKRCCLTSVMHEFSFLAHILCSRPNPSLRILLELCDYGERYFQPQISAISILNEKLHASLANMQDKLREHLRLCDSLDIPASKRSVELQLRVVPVSLRGYFHFAIEYIMTREQIFLKDMDSSLSECVTISEIRNLVERSRDKIPGSSPFFALTEEKIKKRRVFLQNQINMMHEFPITDGPINELEHSARNYRAELGCDDPVLNRFIFEVCLYYTKLSIQIKSSFDPRKEAHSFQYTGKFGATNLLQTVRGVVNTNAFLSLASRLISRLVENVTNNKKNREENLLELCRLRFAFADLEAVAELNDLYKDEIAKLTREPDCWEMLGNDFGFPSEPAEELVPDSVNIPDNSKHTPDVGDPGKQVSSGSNRWDLDALKASVGRYKFFGEDPDTLRKTSSACSYKVTRMR